MKPRIEQFDPSAGFDEQAGSVLRRCRNSISRRVYREYGEYAFDERSNNRGGRVTALRAVIAVLAALLVIVVPFPILAQEPAQQATQQSETSEQESQSEAEIVDLESPPERYTLPPIKPPSVEGLEAVVTEDGITYWEIKLGDGESPHMSAKVTAHITGWLADGTIKENSRARGKPKVFQLDRALRGLGLGIRGMRVGGVRRFFVPWHLGYGKYGLLRGIPPQVNLVFVVELLEVEQPNLPPSVEGIEPVETESGVTYWDLEAGTGPTPPPHGIVTVRYTGWLETTQVFQSSPDDGTPVSFVLDSVIPGWAEGIRTMKAGGRRLIRVPPALAYGDEGQPPMIEPGATLLFEVELISSRPYRGRK